MSLVTGIDPEKFNSPTFAKAYYEATSVAKIPWEKINPWYRQRLIDQMQGALDNLTIQGVIKV